MNKRRHQCAGKAKPPAPALMADGIPPPPLPPAKPKLMADGIPPPPLPPAKPKKSSTAVPDNMGLSEQPNTIKSGFFPKPKPTTKTFDEVFPQQPDGKKKAVNKGFLFNKKDAKQKKKGKKIVTPAPTEKGQVDFFAGAEDEFEVATLASTNKVELGLFTMRNLKPSEVFLTETPLLSFRERDFEIDDELLLELTEVFEKHGLNQIDMYKRVLVAYTKALNFVRRRIATLFHPDVLDQLHKNPRFAKILDLVKDVHRLPAWKGFKEQDLTHLILTADYCGTEDQIYNLHTRIQHHCDPNVVYRITEQGISHFAVKRINKGDELFIHYAQPIMFDFSFSLGPTVMRRARLLQLKQFVCQCSRCIQKVDSTRPLPCPDCHNTCQCELVMTRTEDHDVGTFRWACEDDKSALADMDVKQCCGKVWTQEMLGDLIEEETDFVKKIVMLLEDNRGRADPEAMSLAEQAQLMEECRDTLGENHWATQAMVIACLRDMMDFNQCDRPLTDEAMERLGGRLLRWFSVNCKNSIFHARTASLVQAYNEKRGNKMQLADSHLETLQSLMLMRETEELPELMARSAPDYILDSDLD